MKAIKSKQIRLLFILLIMLASCKMETKTSFKATEKDKFHISGNVENIAEGSKVYLKNDDTGIIEDSTAITKSEFKFNGTVIYPQRYRLMYENGKIIKGHSIWIENVPIEVSFNFQKPKEVKIIAGEQQKIDERLNEAMSFFDPEFNRLIKEKKRDSITNLKLSRTIEQFCYENLNSYLAVEMLHNVRVHVDKDTLCNKLKTLNKNSIDSKYAKTLDLFCNSRVLNVGDNYIDFEAKTLDNKSVSISKLLEENKPILIIFGGLKCIGERGRKMLGAFNKSYKNKVHIIAFVFANNKQQWLYDESYNIGIPLISDLKGNHSPAKIKYHVQNTPTVYVIDKTGKISWKSTGYGSEDVDGHIMSLIEE